MGSHWKRRVQNRGVMGRAVGGGKAAVSVASKVVIFGVKPTGPSYSMCKT